MHFTWFDCFHVVSCKHFPAMFVLKFTNGINVVEATSRALIRSVNSATCRATRLLISLAQLEFVTFISPPGGPQSAQNATIWRLPPPPHHSPPHPRPHEDTQPPSRGVCCLLQLLPEPPSRTQQLCAVQGCEHGVFRTSGPGLVRTGAEAVEQTLRWAGRGAEGVSGRVHHFG